MSIYSAVAFGIEYLYESAMEYLNQTYHQYTSDLKDIPLTKAEIMAINEGGAMAQVMADSIIQRYVLSSDVSDSDFADSYPRNLGKAVF